VRLSNVDTRKLKYKLICCIKLVAVMVRDDFREFVIDTNGPAFLKRGRDGIGCGWVPVGQSAQLCK
jgi:hypothetical protein